MLVVYYSLCLIACMRCVLDNVVGVAVGAAVAGLVVTAAVIAAVCYWLRTRATPPEATPPPSAPPPHDLPLMHQPATNGTGTDTLTHSIAPHDSNPPPAYHTVAYS